MSKVLDGQVHPVVIDIEAASALSVAMLGNSVPLVAQVSSRTQQRLPRREAPQIPLEEVGNAAARVRRADIALSQEELAMPNAKSLVFARASGWVSEHIAAAVVLLTSRGSARRDGDKVVHA